MRKTSLVLVKYVMPVYEPHVDRHIYVSIAYRDARARGAHGISRRRGNIDLHYTTERASISVGTEAPRLLEFFFLTAMISGSSESCARHVDRPIGEGRSRRGGTLQSASNSPRTRRVSPASITKLVWRLARSTWRKILTGKPPEPVS